MSGHVGRQELMELSDGTCGVGRVGHAAQLGQCLVCMRPPCSSVHGLKIMYSFICASVCTTHGNKIILSIVGQMYWKMQFASRRGCGCFFYHFFCCKMNY
jgi:hypothetical protein